MNRRTTTTVLSACLVMLTIALPISAQTTREYDEETQKRVDNLFDREELTTMNRASLNLRKKEAKDRYNSYAFYELNDQTESKYAWASTDFHIVLPFEFEDVDQFSDDAAKIKIDGKWGVIRITDLKILHEPVYDEVFYYRGSENITVLEKDGKEIYMDESGNELPYRILDTDSEKPRRIFSNKRYGFIDASGNIIIPMSFTGALSFSDGLAFVKDSDKSGYIDVTGNMVLETDYDGFFSDGSL